LYAKKEASGEHLLGALASADDALLDLIELSSKSNYHNADEVNHTSTK